jgi:hypothetical protein
MSLEALVGGKIFTLNWLSCSCSDLVPDDILFFFFRCVWQVQQPEGRLG